MRTVRKAHEPSNGLALLHDLMWLGAWYPVHSEASAEAVVFHFGPIVFCSIACASVLAIQIWRQPAGLRANLGRRRELAAFRH